MKRVLSILVPWVIAVALLALLHRQRNVTGRIESDLARQKTQLESAEAAVKSLQNDLNQLRQDISASESSLNAALAKIQSLALAKANTMAVEPVKSPSSTPNVVPKPDGLVPRRSWGPEQATGAPDTFSAGDISTAWASREPNAGAEWLR